MPIGLPPNKPNQPGSGFTNLSRYLQANRQNQLGQAVSTGVQQAGQQARGAIGQAGQEFEQKVGQERSRLGQQEQKVGQILGGNVAGVSDPDVQTFHNVLGAESRGPTGVQNADELRSKSQEAEALGRAGGSEAGRFGLLQRYVGRGTPSYTAGQQRLDQMLLGQTGQKQLRQARGGTVGLTSEAERQIGSATERGKELQSEARGLAERTQGKLGQSITDYDVAMQNQLAGLQNQYNQILGLFKPGAASNAPIEIQQDMLDKLSTATGGQLAADKTLYNADVSPFVAINSLYNTKQAAQNAEDLARIQGLEKLGGKFLTTPQAQLTQAYTTNPSLVGKLKENPFEAQQGAIADAINAAKSQYENEVAAANRTVQGAARTLGVAAPGVYSTTGGDIGELLTRYYDRRMNPDLDVYAPSINAQRAQLQQVLSNYATDPSSGSLNKLTPGYSYIKQMYAPVLGDIESAISYNAAHQGLANSYGTAGTDFDRAVQKYQADLAALQQAEEARTGLDTTFQTLRKIKAKQPAPQV